MQVIDKQLFYAERLNDLNRELLLPAHIIQSTYPAGNLFLFSLFSDKALVLRRIVEQEQPLISVFLFRVSCLS